MSYVIEYLIYLGISAFLVALVGLAAAGSALAIFLLWALITKKV